MNVSYVTMQFPAPSETFASNDIRELTARGVEIDVHALLPQHHRHEALRRERDLMGIEVTHNDVGASFRGLLTAVQRPGLLFRTVSWLVRHTAGKPGHLLRSLVLLPRAFDILTAIERSRPDLVHLYWGHYPSIVGFLVQQTMPEIATTISLVAYDLEMQYGPTAPVARAANAVRTLGRVNVEDVSAFTGLPPADIEVIFDGVNLARIEEIGSRHRKVPRRIVTAGRLIRSKGMHHVLDAFFRIRAKWPDATLRVLGEGVELERLRAQANTLGLGDSVTFLGHASHDRVIEELAQAEVFMLLSSKSSERLPNVVKEGMACRAVCVTTPTPGIEELVEHGHSGYIVPMNDPVAAAAAVEEIFAGGAASEVAARAREHIASHFDLAATSQRYIEMWSDASGQSRPKSSPRPTPESQAVGAS